MRLNTASEVINFALALEDKATEFYNNLAKRYEKDKDIFTSFAREGIKNKKLIKRVYYSVVSDALETGFSFEGIDANNYLSKIDITAAKGFRNAIQMAIELERGSQRFYLDIAERARSLMADLPRIFMQIARKRGERERKLEELLKARA